MDSTEADEPRALLGWFEPKDGLRTGWVLRGIESPESVAAHTWGVATLCPRYAERAGVDSQRAVAMALVHDLEEARTADVATPAEEGRQNVDASEKAATERRAVTDLLAPFDDGVLLSLWEEYEARDTPTARFVEDVDPIDSCLQALEDERRARYDESEADEHFSEFGNLDEFFATAAPRQWTELGEDLFERSEVRDEQEIGRPCRL